ncbi:MAG: HD domain-containing protein [bacterium]|nr:HD domain-containing protein [bacterium]
MVNKVFRDPLYGYVRVNDEIIDELINSTEFQRLRRIKQLCGVSMVFHMADHTRFSHSLGAYELAREVLEKVIDVKNALNDYEKTVFLCSALLHDVGHGPYSHSFEKIFKISHETMTNNIILGDSHINKILTKYNPNLASDIASVISHKHKFPLIEQLVSSQLDVDRMDYLRRDAYFTGAQFGDIDIEKILRGMLVKNGKILFKYNSVPNIEDYLMSRYHMYYQVYFHPVSRCFEVMLEMIYQRWYELIKSGYQFRTDVSLLIDVIDKKTVDAFLKIDDVYVNGCIQQFQYEKDRILSDLATRLFNRKLFNHIDLKYASDEQVDEIKKLKNNDKYYYKEDVVAKSAYDYQIDEQIKVLIPGDKEVDLLEFSPIVKAFSRSSKYTSKLIYYSEI